MNKIIKNYSTNCSACGKEVNSYQLRPCKVGSVLIDLCPSCHESSNAYNQFKQSLAILIELQKSGALDPENDAQTNSPNIIVEPIDSNINAAINLLKRMNPSYFVGVSKIVAGSESNYGHVSSEDPGVVHINLGRIANETKDDDSKRNIIIALAVTISHECAHAKSFKDGNFAGGESVALAEEQKVLAWIKSNENRLQDLFK